MSIRPVIITAAFIAFSGAASAATLFTDDFESYSVGTPASIAPTWTVVEGSVDVIGAPAFPWYPTQQIDMNGSGGDSTAAVIFTTITGFVVDQFYTLSFDYGSNKNSNGDEKLFFYLVGANNVLTSLFEFVTTSGPVPDLLTASYTFKATDTEMELYFQDGQAYAPFDDDNDQGGPILDNVLVEDVAPVPLPAAAPLLLAGLGGLAMLRRRRKA